MDKLIPFVDQIRHFSIHEDDFKELPKKVRKCLKDKEDLAYVNMSDVVDKPMKFNHYVKQYVKCVKQNKGQESNVECMIIDSMVFMLQHMTADDIRKLHLEKLLK
jgi:hypothetical protein